MTVFDLDELVLKNRRLTALTNLRYRKSDRLQWPVRFLQDEGFIELPVESSLSVAVKRTRSSNSYLALATSPAKTGTGSNAIYTFDLNLNTEPVSYELSDKELIECVLEVEVVTPAQRLTSQSVPLVIERDVIANDPPPATLPDLKASQAEAEAGADNGKWMTPLRTAQAIAALAGGGSYVLKQASFQAESGKRYLVGVGPDGGGTSGSGEGGSDGSGGSIGSPETEIIITLPANPQPADAIVILDAFGNWKPTRFGQSAIPAVINLNGNLLEGWSPASDENPYAALPCSCILTFAGGSVGWRITRIETGKQIDLGYGSSLDLCRSYPDAVVLKNEQDSPAGWPRFVAQGSQGRTVSFGMGNYGPLIDVNDTLRIGQFPSPIRVSQLNTLNGPPIKVPIWNTGLAMDMAVFLGTTHYPDPNAYAPGAVYFDALYDDFLICVQDARPLKVTLTGTTHNIVNGTDINGEYSWAYDKSKRSTPVYRHTSGIAELRWEKAWWHWRIYVNDTLYFESNVNDGTGVYPMPWGWEKILSNPSLNEVTDFTITRDATVKRFIKASRADTEP